MAVTEQSSRQQLAAARGAFSLLLRNPRWRKALRLAGVGLVTLVVWAIVASVSSPFFFPSPTETLRSAIKLTLSGDLPNAIAISYFRIIAGWALGGIVAVPLAIVAARIPFVRAFLEPYINFFRFVPPIALLGIAILWFGIGETAKIAIIVYTSLFTVFMNTMAGALATDVTPERAALCLGASRRQILTHVVLPATIPAIIVGLRIGMGFSFMTVVAAELVAANEGIGFLIYNARLFMQTGNAFTGIIALGLMGVVADWAFCFLARRAFPNHDLKF